jgi:hypothetical protein
LGIDVEEDGAHRSYCRKAGCDTILP